MRCTYSGYMDLGRILIDFCRGISPDRSKVIKQLSFSTGKVARIRHHRGLCSHLKRPGSVRVTCLS